MGHCNFLKLLFFQIGHYIAEHLQNVLNVDKPNPYLRWTDRWEPISDDYVPNAGYDGQNRSVPQHILIYNKVPRVG